MKNPFNDHEWPSVDDQADELKDLLRIAISHIGLLVDVPEINSDDVEPETGHILKQANAFYNQTKALDE